MKKLTVCLALAVLLALLSLCAAADQQFTVGGTVFFGRYEQDNKNENGEEPIEWQVLDVKDGKALLISKYALDCMPYNNTKEDTTWAQSSIRRWLNNIFFNDAFGKDESAIILETTVSNVGEGQVGWTTDGGQATNDRLFLLSVRELGMYFTTEDTYKTSGTEYARDKGAKFLGITTIGIDKADWWLRSPGTEQHDAAYVGALRNIVTKEVNASIGIRPAMWITITGDQSALPYTVLQQANQYMEQQDYSEAARLYESLGSYADCVQLATEARYQQACQAEEKQEYASAESLFEALDDYKDSYDRLRNCRYTRGISSLKNADYDKAIELFTEVGQYKDSMYYLEQCFKKKNYEILYFTDAETVNTGHDNGYFNKNALSDKDLHSGWKMGTFIVSGFTTKTDDDGIPVILKKVGDTVTLWFRLEQNIDELNKPGSNLSVSDDKNGWSAKFDEEEIKEGFGRGTLIVEKKDARSQELNKAQVYTNYLAARATSGARTEVVLNEEGDYTIALYYEVCHKYGIGGAMNEFQNYAIYIDFKIRNGNCMVFPFDVVTGSELQNTSVTQNGFYLDLARSRDLKINVVYSILVNNGVGFVEDVRQNAPAKDGDRYVKEGIYTITVENEYTGETTTKTIFVGTDELLQKYISMGFSEDRLQ